KACEIDAINGVVCDFGKANNVKTPVNDRIVSVIKRIEKGELKAEPANIRLFDDLL
ncbi:MAG: 2-dehydropantoate 2-reductase, partial [Clostridia bacterium]|nr:2-dehydropantoate 2-reductase [Clostridia bacterium]